LTVDPFREPGEFAYGALEGGFFDNGFAVAFYSAFAWIYLNQWFLYQKVNQLMEDQGGSPVWVASENLGEQQWIRNMHQLRPIYLHVSAY